MHHALIIMAVIMVVGIIVEAVVRAVDVRYSCSHFIY
jgi:hypothetical protein